MEKIKVVCGKCEGTGFLSEYKVISRGRCFACNGVGYHEYTQKQLDAKEKRKQKKEDEARLKLEWIPKREPISAFIENVKDNPIFIKLMENCPSERYYEMHANNARKCMIARGQY